METNKKKYLLYVGMTILFVIAIVGVSYAAYVFSGTGTTENVITTGNLEVSFEEQNNILIKDRYPETDTEGLANTDSNSQMTFTISSNIVGNATVNYAVGLVEIEEDTTLTQDYIKFNLTKNGSAANGFTTTTGKTIKSFENETFGELLTSHVITQGSITGTQVDTYTLKAWIDENYNLPKTDTSSGNSHSVTTTSEEFSFKIKVAGTDATINEEEEPNIPNAPELATNMIPVTYDGENWVKADSTNSNNSWYNYDNKVWANAVTVTSANRQKYLDATAGTPIAMDDINTMWVWIPRFSATIPELDCSTVVGATYETHPMCYEVSLTDNDKTNMAKAFVQMFGMSEEDAVANVKTIQNGGTFDMYGTAIDMSLAIAAYDMNKDMASLPALELNHTYDSTIQTTYQGVKIKFTRTSEISHDAFTFGSDELSGFWMAKFEPSHPTLSDVSEPNLLGCTNDTCANAKNIEILPNKISLRRNNVSNFFYAGRSMEQTGNLYGLISNEIDTHMMKNNEWGAVAYLTYSEFGRCNDDLVCTDIGINNNSSYITGYGAPAGSAVGVENGAYNSALGMDSSTTGNIYGVYDMSGGAYEYVMGVYKPDTLSEINDYSGFSTEISNSQYDKFTIGTQYYNVYTTSEAYDNAGLQHAVNETNGWYEDVVVFVFYENPWFARSGYFENGDIAGVFTADNYLPGDAYITVSFRPVLIK